MRTKKILGLYVDRDSLHYVSSVKRVSGYTLKTPGAGFESSGVKKGNGYTLLKTFLSELSSDPSRNIYLALPRSQVFIREIPLPPMSIEDVLSAVKNSLSIYSHLDPEDIYYDVIISPHGDDTYRVLLLYAAKDDIDRYRTLFSETGHGAALKGILPLSYGLCVLLDGGDKDNHTLFSFDQENVTEFFLASGSSLAFSMSCASNTVDEKKMIMASAHKKYPDLKYPQGETDSDSATLGNGINNNKLRFLPDWQKNLAAAAVAPAFSRIQQVSLDSQPVRIKVVYPVRYIIPFICALIALLWYVTDLKHVEFLEADELLTQMKQQVKQIESDLAPLQSQIDTLQKASILKKDVEEFMHTRPALYSAVNEIATLIPKGTWFGSFTFNNRGIVLRGTGKDAFKTLEALRGSELFDNVAFRGSVSRSATGEERFTITLQLSKKTADGADNEAEEGPR